jgi:hypothetical protein
MWRGQLAAVGRSSEAAIVGGPENKPGWLARQRSSGGFVTI